MNNRRLARDDLPMWRWASLVTPDFFINLPPDFNWDLVPGDDKPAEEAKAAAIKPKEKKPMFRYARIEIQRCVDSDLSFCKALATVHLRVSEERGEKMFLRGNSFLSKLAKSILEQNGDLFVEACQKYKDEAYFNECANTIKEWNFSANEGEEFSKESWRSLYKVVLLLTEEYYATKCDLPKVGAFESKDNDDNAGQLEIIAVPQGMGEADITNASLAPMFRDELEDSSDNIRVGELFYEFLCENFPFKSSQSELSDFIERAFGKEVRNEFSIQDTTVKSLPRPEFKIDAMVINRLGSYKNKTIFINQRIALDALYKGNSENCFALLLAMLIEYGRFLNEVFHEKAKKPITDSGEKNGKFFMSEFIKYSENKLLKKDSVKFVDFIAPDPKGKELKFTVEYAGLNYEQKLNIFYFLKSSSV